jgi:type IV secretory pathway VirB10-like protein
MDTEETAETVPDEVPYELTPDEATGFETASAAGFFDRKKVMMVLCIAFVFVVGGGLLLNLKKDRKQPGTDSPGGATTARAPAEFLRTQRDRALSARPEADGAAESLPEPLNVSDIPAEYQGDSPVNQVIWNTRTENTPGGGTGAAPAPPGGGAGGTAAEPSAYRSLLVPDTIEGSLFGGRGSGSRNTAGSYAEQYPYLDPQAQAQNAVNEYLARTLAGQGAVPAASPAALYAGSDPYTLQNNQDNKQGFYDSGSGGGVLTNGAFLPDNSLWIGTILPGILETGINTDLPGNVIARVTQNIYDSRTGKNLLIPQGTTLIARYNSSVSYAQSRVQIVWDTLIRPDGFLLELGGMNGVDRRGMSGQEAEYHENWFEYLKAAGIITLFSVANSKMTEEAAKYASSATASGIAQANAEFVNQVGGNIVSRAMNIQPTLTVDNGALINIMLNKTIYLPPVDDYPVTKKYTLE